MSGIHLAVILIWWFGGFSSGHQIKITANTIVSSQILINSNEMNELICQTKYQPICFSSQIAKLNVLQMYHSYGIHMYSIYTIIIIHMYMHIHYYYYCSSTFFRVQNNSCLFISWYIIFFL